MNKNTLITLMLFFALQTGFFTPGHTIASAGGNFDQRSSLTLLPPTAPCGTLDGTIVDSMETTGDWSVISGGGAISGSLSSVSGYNGQALQLNYDLGTNPGAWVQVRRDFNPPLDWSAGDHLRFLHMGTAANTVEIGLVSAAGENFFGSSWNEASHVPWWTYATWDFKDFLHSGQPFPDFSQVKAIFISVTKTADAVGGSGSFTIDELQIDDLASRTVPSSFASVTVEPTVLGRAASWIGNQQQSGGLLKSWYEESLDYAWLYDQALGLIVLSETDSAKANQLANKLHSLQNGDGSWYYGYHYLTNSPIDTKKDIGPIAWTIYALMHYYFQNPAGVQAAAAYQDARQGAAWLASQQNGDGSLSNITEWNMDSWWAFQITGYQQQADRLKDYLLNRVWDNEIGRFKSSDSTYQIFLDNQTWGAPFLRAIGRPADARRALSYAHSTLTTSNSSGTICGFDGAGPFSVWNEGSAQYIDQGGENSQYYWDQLVSQQVAGGLLDGSMPNSPDSFLGYIVWLSPWHGIAPTAWLYFAGTDGPFTETPPHSPDAAPDRNDFTTSTPTLTWSQINWATGYQMQVDNNANFSSPEYNNDTIPNSILKATTPSLPNGTYFWRVRAKRANGSWGGWSRVDSFVINSP
ncbi:MAG: terpene cyclase/mutase family protein [Anaerolineae bacterium]|nr:terpene cyclase/mutase family protein [Anaerolineae bacterium]